MKVKKKRVKVDELVKEVSDYKGNKIWEVF